MGLCLLECFEVYHFKLDYTKPVGEEEGYDDTFESIASFNWIKPFMASLYCIMSMTTVMYLKKKLKSYCDVQTLHNCSLVLLV